MRDISTRSRNLETSGGMFWCVVLCSGYRLHEEKSKDRRDIGMAGMPTKGNAQRTVAMKALVEGMAKLPGSEWRGCIDLAEMTRDVKGIGIEITTSA